MLVTLSHLVVTVQQARRRQYNRMNNRIYNYNTLSALSLKPHQRGTQRASATIEMVRTSIYRVCKWEIYLKVYYS